VHPGAQAEQAKAVRLLRDLFRHFLDHPDLLPPEYHRAPGDLPVRVADYISGMTDRFALMTYERLFLPRGWPEEGPRWALEPSLEIEEG
jgi:dGTPase